MWQNPTRVTSDIIAMAVRLDCDWVGALEVRPEITAVENNCHNNVKAHTELYGGTSQVGFYFIKGFGTIQAIRHTVWNNDNRLVDITPYTDNRAHIIFGKSRLNDADYTLSNCYAHALDKYIKQEVELMYYVYQLVDPRTGEPFYIGKGSGNRAESHFKETPDTRNQYKENKISSIRAAGLEPEIRYVAENIIDESLAYDIEASMIERYGRKGYDKNGILTNICKDNRPPNHKGKTYDEIYGPARAKEQRELRSKLQKERGGYGPTKHSEETKELFRLLNTGARNPMYGRTQKDSTKQLISEKARLRIGEKNKLSKQYRITSPSGEERILWGGDAALFCRENNLSYSTLKMQIQQGWGIPKKGKTKGWKFEEVTSD